MQHFPGGTPGFLPLLSELELSIVTSPPPAAHYQQTAVLNMGPGREEQHYQCNYGLDVLVSALLLGLQALTHGNQDELQCLQLKHSEQRERVPSHRLGLVTESDLPHANVSCAKGPTGAVIYSFVFDAA